MIKNILKTSILLLPLGLPHFSRAQDLTEGKIGNGGYAMVCREKIDGADKITVELLDLFEANSIDGNTVFRQYKGGNPQLNRLEMNRILRGQLNQLQEIERSELSSYLYTESLKVLDAFKFTKEDVDLVETHDAIRRVGRRDCKINQLANYISDDKILIAKDLYNQIPWLQDIAALALHEVIYRDDREHAKAANLPVPNSDRTREIVGMLFSKPFQVNDLKKALVAVYPPVAKKEQPVVDNRTYVVPYKEPAYTVIDSLPVIEVKDEKPFLSRVDFSKLFPLLGNKSKSIEYVRSNERRCEPTYASYGPSETCPASDGYFTLNAGTGGSVSRFGAKPLQTLSISGLATWLDASLHNVPGTLAFARGDGSLNLKGDALDYEGNLQLGLMSVGIFFVVREDVYQNFLKMKGGAFGPTFLLPLNFSNGGNYYAIFTGGYDGGDAELSNVKVARVNAEKSAKTNRSSRYWAEFLYQHSTFGVRLKAQHMAGTAGEVRPEGTERPVKFTIQTLQASLQKQLNFIFPRDSITLGGKIEKLDYDGASKSSAEANVTYGFRFTTF